MRLSKTAFAITFSLFLLIGTLAAYGPALHAGYIRDDDAYVQDNPVFTSQNTLSQIWLNRYATPQWYPVVFTILYAEKLLWGLNPAGFHLINVLAHAANAILLWCVLRRMKVPGAPLAAAVFALHPIMVESVAWISEAKNTFSTLFFLISLLAFLKFALPREEDSADFLADFSASSTDAPPPAPPPPAPPVPPPAINHWLFYGISLLFFILALLSKIVVCGLPPVLLLILWWKRPPHAVRSALLTIPFFVLGLVACLNTAMIELNHAPTTGNAWQLQPAEKILLAGRAICFYAGKILFPIHLSFYYTAWTLDPAAGWQWLFPLAVVAIIVIMALGVRRLGKAPLVAALSFLILLLPALGLFPLLPMFYSWVADHFAYLGAMVFISAICALLDLASERWIPPKYFKPETAIALSLPVLLALGVTTNFTARNYESAETLWRSVLLSDIDHPHWDALTGMSQVLKDKAQAALISGQHDDAMVLNEQSRAFDEKSLEVRPDYPVAYNNIATYYLFKGDPTDALPNALKAIELQNAQGPHAADARFLITLADTYRELHQYDKALDSYLRAIQLDRYKVGYHIKMAHALIEAGQEPRARQYIANALSIDPHNAEAHLLQGFLLARADHLPEALEEFRQAVNSDPDNAEARDSFAKAAALLPEAGAGDLEAAMTMAQRNVSDTQGTNLAYIDTLGILFRRAGRNDVAVNLLLGALKNVPNADEGSRQQLIRHIKAWAPPGTTIPSFTAASAPATASAPSSAPSGPAPRLPMRP